MPITMTGPAIEPDTLRAAAEAAARAIPPAWPLAATVAVNPYLGQSGHDLAHTAALLARVSGAPMTMPRGWYRERIAAGSVTDADLDAALAAAHRAGRPASLAALKAAALTAPVAAPPLPSIADLAAQASGIDWPAIIAERFGAWAGGYFDEGQALWAAPKGPSAFAAWKWVATHDLTPEIAGLSGFAAFVAGTAEAMDDALARSVQRLGLAPAALPTYFHGLLLSLGGWAQYARYRLWQAELAGGTDDTLAGFLAIRLLWEEALLARYGAQIDRAWEAAMSGHARPVEPTADQIVDAILQEACERAAQRELDAALTSPSAAMGAAEPVLQAAFCIDVRSEVFRRALESIDPQIRTLGFAGFFGLGVSHHRFASDVAELRLPVLLNPGLTSRSGTPGDAEADLAARLRARAVRAWGRFKLAAVSSFAFVEAAGPAYIAKLLRDALGLHRSDGPDDPAPHDDPAPDLAARVATAAAVLRAMSLTEGFAPLVLLVGHGANVVNNPHASALHCGACGGYPGDVNARLLAALLNDGAVRAGLREAGLMVPETTLFVAGLHDTTTDAVRIFADDTPSPAHAPQLAQARAWLEAAGLLARSERALRLPRANGAGSLAARSRDWSETRPEWGLAGCRAFIAAPRSRTAGRDLGGRAFLHDYDWRADTGFGILELILTAPVVVASWISLQYYGSSVAPGIFGAGNKLLHNVIGGFGVVEGNGGVLRAGLPWQSVHDGRGLVHEPLRLTVCIEAPRAAMSAILGRHPGVRALFDNRWLHLLALGEHGRPAWRYRGDLEWEPYAPEVAPAGVPEPVA